MKYRALTILLLALMAGCGEEKQKEASNPASPDSGGYGGYYDAAEIKFLDEASSNSSLDTGLTSISFVAPTGEERLVRDLAPGKTVVLVFTRGNTVPICPYCSTQTAQLISEYDSFKERNAEVAVVYPIETGDDKSRLDGFLADVKTKLADASQPVPFPILLDVELKGVDQLGIRKNLSKPATYIVDSEGNVQYAYVGSHLADRPGVQALLGEIDKLKLPSDHASNEAAPKATDDSTDKVKPTEDPATE